MTTPTDNLAALLSDDERALLYGCMQASYQLVADDPGIRTSVKVLRMAYMQRVARRVLGVDLTLNRIAPTATLKLTLAVISDQEDEQ